MEKITTARFRVYGIVQGVGFRPTVDRHASTSGIRGSVCNKGPYVEIFAQGTREQIGQFETLLREQPPRRSSILKIDKKEIAGAQEYSSFSIVESEKTDGEIFISPDIAICEECTKELYDPHNRRYLHPFINCTCCGPRLTILDALPYDRERTSMKMFPMCRTCAEEYYSPLSRRYDAQPVCCNECGPEVYLLPTAGSTDAETGFLPLICVTEKTVKKTDPVPPGSERNQSAADKDKPGTNPAEGQIRGREAIKAARKVILAGGIVAVKGIGGFHLCCDATNEEAVRRLRERKRRPAKPFAVMMKDEETVRRECLFNEEQRQILTGHQKPILLLDRNQEKTESDKSGKSRGPSKDQSKDQSIGDCKQPVKNRLAPSVAPGNPKVGVMLPYAPLQLLLFDYDDGLQMPDCLIMTSGNVSGAPICRDDKDALAELSGFCDCILSHNRLIRIRADDTVMDFHRGHPYMIRRSRGYAPLPVLYSGENNGRDPDPGDAGEDADEKEAAGKNSGNRARSAGQDDAGMAEDREDTSKSAGQEETAKADEQEDPTVFKGCVLAVGGELKNTFCIASGNLLYLSPYVGDLEDLRTVRALEETIGRMEKLLEVSPRAIVCDLHPKYNSTEIAEELAAKRNIPLLRIQHHYAHILSCMAENDRRDPVIGVSFDGTGYGQDGTIWGGEIMVADAQGYERVRSIAPFLQIGGDSAPRQGWRIAASMIREACNRGFSLHDAPQPEKAVEPSGKEGKTQPEKEAEPLNVSNAEEKGFIQNPPEESVRDKKGPADNYFDIIQTLSICDEQNARAQRMMAERGIQAVTSTSAGRLFDAVSAMLGICRESTYEGEASIELEFAAERYSKKRFGDPLASKDRICVDDCIENDCIENDCIENVPAASCGDKLHHLPTDRLFEALLRQRLNGEDPEKLAWLFHAGLAKFISDACIEISEERGIRTAALTGGCFQNRLLLTLVQDSLTERGMEVLIHHLVPPNDGGIALGQALAGMFRQVPEEK